MYSVIIEFLDNNRETPGLLRSTNRLASRYEGELNEGTTTKSIDGIPVRYEDWLFRDRRSARSFIKDIKESSLLVLDIHYFKRYY